MNISDLLQSTPDPVRTRDQPFVWNPGDGIPTFSIATRPLKQRRGRQTTRDQRRDIKMAYRCGKTPYEISKIVDLSERRVKYALKEPDTPKKPTGRPPKLDTEQRRILVDYVCTSKATRRMTFKELSQEFCYWECGPEAIENALKREGFGLRSAMRKPPISEKNRKLRLKFAKEHRDWTFQQWCKFLWSDETWVKYGRHRKTKVLRRPNEEWHKDCIEEKVQRKKGWMFWGSFYGCCKGPGVFWEKDWGTINAKTYCQRILPVVAQFLADNNGLRGEERELIFMQDNAPGHAAKETIAMIEAFGILRLKWPPFSPDLNPIETVWKYMKNYLEDKYGDYVFQSYDEQRRRIWEAWDKIVTPGLLIELIKSMPKRMEAVIAAEGRFTKY